MVRNGTFQLCPICQFFGSTLMASKLSIRDATLAGDPKPPVHRRDGVGINRDTEVAQEHIKYDFEVLESGVAFKTVLCLENAEASDFALLYILLQEWKRGLEFGGKRSRGLGRSFSVRIKYNISTPNRVTALHLSFARGLQIWKMSILSYCCRTDSTPSYGETDAVSPGQRN